MKKKFRILIGLLIIFQIVIGLKSIAVDNDHTYTQEELAIREVANAYYMKGTNIQYDGWRLSQTYPPEEATSQHETYSCCTNYTYLIYNQAFGIDGGYLNSNRMIAYGKKYYDPDNVQTNDIIEYWQKKKDNNGNVYYEDNQGNRKEIELSSTDGRKAYAQYLMNDVGLQVGDIICYHNGGAGSGHGVIVYEIKYDKNGNPEDIIFRESTSSYDTTTNKTDKGLCYMDYDSEVRGIHEGTHRELNFIKKYLVNSNYSNNSKYNRHSVAYNFQNANYLTVIRTLLKDENGNYTGKYYSPTFQYNSKEPTRYLCTGRTLEEYQITDVTLQRIRYSQIDIEKTVDVFNSSVVNIGDYLKYTIKVTNNSDNTYDDFDVIEQIPEYVEIIESSDGNINGNTITWNVSNLASKQTHEIKYKVRVKKDISYIGKEIVSTGTVAGIPSATIKNPISRNLTEEQKSATQSELQNIISEGNNSGKALVSTVYNNVYGINLSLDSLDITDLIQVAGDENKNYDINSYHDEDGDSWYQKPTVYLNDNNPFANMVMSNYYGALRTNSDGKVYQRYWENLRSKTISRSDRADSINEENFQMGDILIYKNTQTPTGSKTYPQEDGTYYFIYVDETHKISINGEEVCGFVGIDDNGNLKYVQQDYIEMRNLLAKDYFVVLRPSLCLDLLPMQLNVKYSTTAKTNKDVYIEITSNEEMLPVDGWNLSGDQKSLSKTYTENGGEQLKIYDYGGNAKDVNVNVKNIDKTISVQYKSHIQNIGWQAEKKDGQTSGTSGKSLRMEAVKISLINAPEGASIMYKAHVQDIGWQDWNKDGALAGTEGQSKRVEAFKIKLLNLDEYSVKYRVHIQDIGWQDWKYDGQMAGTEGQSKRLEAVEIVIVDKVPNVQVICPSKKAMYYSNDKISDSGTYLTNLKNSTLRAYIDGVEYTQYVTTKKLSPLDPDTDQDRYLFTFEISDLNAIGDGKHLIEYKLFDNNGTEKAKYSREVVVNTKDIHILYQTHVQDIGWQDKEFKDGEMAGTTGKSKRVEAIKIRTQNLPQGVNISYQAHVANIGWMNWTKEGALAGTTGRSLGIEAIRIKLNNDDNYTLKYRAHVANIGWQDWKYDGEMSGTTGLSNSIEAIEIVLMPKEYRTIIGFDNANKTLFSEDTYLTGYYLSNASDPTLEAFVDKQSITNQITLSANSKIYTEHEGYGDSSNTPKPNYKIFIPQSYIDNWKSGNHELELVVKENGTKIFSKKYAIKVDIDNLHIRYTIDNYNNPVSQVDDAVLENGKNINNIKVHLINNKDNIKLESLGFFTDYSWNSTWVNDGTILTGLDQPMQAVRYKLDSENYSILYKVKIDGVWQDYACDGEYAGIINQKKNITAIKMKVVSRETEKKAKVWIDFPKENLKRGKYTFYGWGVCNDSSATLKLLLDGKEVSIQRCDRPDVLDAIKGYRGDITTPNPGFQTSVDLTKASYGTHNVVLQYVDNNGKVIDSQKISFLVNDKITVETGTYGKSGLKIKNGKGYDLEYYRFGDGPNVAFFTFEVHGFEDHWDRDGTELVLTAIQFFDRLKSDNDIDLANKWTIYLFPQCNPDGRIEGHTNNGPGRTTLYSVYGDVGVDMNRCWSTNFEPKYNARNYTGDFSFGAYEAQYLKDFMLSHKSQKGQTILVDCHGWLSQLIGDTDMMNYYQSQFPDSRLTYTYGKGYLITWARANLGTNGNTAKSILVELPASVNSPKDFVNQNVANKFIKASIDMLKGLN